MSTPTTDAAKAYARASIFTTPIPHGEKVPTLKGWQNLRLATEADVERYFNGHPQNIGVLLGASGLVDVDVDTAEAAALAPVLLPTTRTFGRPGNPSSHRIYRVAERRKTERHQIPISRKAETIIEYRDLSTKGTPVQTVFPPSTHPSGEIIAWDGEPGEPFAEIEADDLARHVRHVAGLAVLLRYYPRGNGGRHDLAGALASVLARSGVADKTAELVAAFAAFTGDDEIQDRVQYAEDTIKAIRAGQATTGAPTLIELLCPTPEAEKNVRKALTWLDFDGRTAPAEPPADEPDPDDDKGKRRTASSVLVDLVTDKAELWHDAEREAYISFDTPAGGREHHPLRTKAAREFVGRLYYLAEGRAPGGQTTEDAFGVLSGRAKYDGPEYRTAVRASGVTDDAGGETLYLDLGNDTGEVVETTAAGWRVISGAACPIRFVRRPGLLPLPAPVSGGSIDDLRPILNTPEEGFRLIIAWLLCAIRARAPYPILGFSGEQGTGKSTAARYVRRLVDPNVAGLRDLPRNAREAYISTAASHVQVYDNVSRIQPAQSDVLCRLASGGGYAVRALHTDADEAIFNEAAPQILTGIGDVVTRPDLAERTLAVPLERIGADARQTEADLDAAFEAAQPRVLGALLDAASDGLRLLPITNPGRLPRLADAARWVIACEAGDRIGASGSFMSAFDSAKEELVEAALDAEPIAGLIRQLRDEANPTTGETVFKGTSTELLDRLVLLYRKDDEKRRLPAGWPTSARGLSSAVTRSAPPLRSVGIDCERAKAGRGDDRKRVWIVRHVAQEEGRSEPSPPSPPSPGGRKAPVGSEKADNVGTVGGTVGDGGAVLRPPPSPDRPHQKPVTESPLQDSESAGTVGTVGTVANTSSPEGDGTASSPPDLAEPWDAEEPF